jgi:hypothetical protein
MSIHTRGTDPHEPLDAVLRAASAPGHPEELAGERAALAAFQVAEPRRRSLLARVLTVKALVIGGVALSTGTVLAVAGGVFMPILRDEPAPTTPAEPPAVTRTSESAVPPLTRPPSTTAEPPAGEPTTEQSRDECRDCRDKEEDERDRPDDSDRPGKDDKDKDGKGGQPPPTRTSERAGDETEPSSSRAQTPDSPAHGAVTAVPPAAPNRHLRAADRTEWVRAATPQTPARTHSPWRPREQGVVVPAAPVRAASNVNP